MPSNSVFTTSVIEIFTNGVVSYGYTTCRPCGKYGFSSSILARTAFAVSSALAPGASWMPIPDDRLSVVARVDEVRFGAQLDARDVANAHLRPVGIDLEQNVFELRRRAQQCRLGDGRGQSLRRRRRSPAELPSRDLDVLVL